MVCEDGNFARCDAGGQIEKTGTYSSQEAYNENQPHMFVCEFVPKVRPAPARGVRTLGPGSG